jgi:flagellar basal body-associated protein FliL
VLEQRSLIGPERLIAMAEKAEKKPEEKAPAAPPAPAAEKKDAPAKKEKGGGLFTKLPVLIGIVMVLEAVVLFAGFKFLGAGAKPAQAADLSVDAPSDENKSEGKEGEGGEKGKAPLDKKKPVVVKVTEFKAPNKKSGNGLLFDLKICVVTKAEYEKRIEDAIADKEPLIQDRIRTIIAQSDPDKLSGGSEPGLETFRRQVKYQLDEIIGDGMIDEVLVPRMIPFRTDY